MCRYTCPPLREALSLASWQSRAGTADRTDWISGGTSGRAEDIAEGEGKNRGNRKSTESRGVRKSLVSVWVDYAVSFVRTLRRTHEGQI